MNKIISTLKMIGIFILIVIDNIFSWLLNFISGVILFILFTIGGIVSVLVMGRTGLLGFYKLVAENKELQ